LTRGWQLGSGISAAAEKSMPQLEAATQKQASEKSETAKQQDSGCSSCGSLFAQQFGDHFHALYPFGHHLQYHDHRYP
jgi:hypothetical protein